MSRNKEKIISYSTLNQPGIFWKMGKFENVITQITKTKVKMKNRSFLFTLCISNWEIILSALEQKKVKILLYSIILTDLGSMITLKLILNSGKSIRTKKVTLKSVCLHYFHNVKIVHILADILTTHSHCT